MVTKIHHIIHILLLHNSTNSKSKMINLYNCKCKYHANICFYLTDIIFIYPILNWLVVKEMLVAFHWSGLIRVEKNNLQHLGS